MKNEIGRKLTSLTIMAIMFAGGMTLAVPGFMPDVSAAETTSGLLTVSTTTLQGVAILEVIVNDPDYSATDADISALEVDVGSNTYDMTQATNGKWYLYVVDASQSALFDADANGFEFGVLCTAGLGTEESTTDLIVGTSTDIYAAVITGAGVGVITDNGTCLDADGMQSNLDDTAGTTSRDDLTAAVLQNAPALSNPDGDEANQGQRAHKLNASGYGSWPYIISVNLNDDNIVEYGSDSINVVYGNTDDDSSIELTNRNPGDRAEVHLTITDPALNIDPTTADIWKFSLASTAAAPAVIFANNGSNTALDAEELGQHGCVDNCRLYSNVQTNLSGSLGDNALTAVTMTETGSSTDVFESFDTNGSASFTTTAEAAADGQVIYNYGGNSVDQVITYNDATITMDAGGSDWAPGNTATITVVDPEANRNPTSAETLNAYDETVVLPVIKMGTGGLAISGGNNPSMAKGEAGATTGVVMGHETGSPIYTLTITNTTDNSDRLRIIANAGDMGTSTHTWLNVTTGHTRADLVALAGTSCSKL